MRRLLPLSVAAFAAGVSFAASVVETKAVQEWPWSSRVTIEYILKDVTSPVDVSVRISRRGGAPLDYPEVALSGDLHAQTRNGLKRIFFDPVRAFGEKGQSGDYEFALTPVASPAKMSEVLYKIFDLVNTNVTDVTRAELLNGDYGTVETDFGAIGEGYATSLTDVLIWTGVTNYPGVRTTKLVMRKIPAGSYPGGTVHPGEAKNTYTMSKDVFAGVFELTQAQWRNCGAPTGTANNYKYRPVWLGDERPIERINSSFMLYGHTHSEGRDCLTPGSEGDNCLFRALQNRFHAVGISVPFDLPSWMQWQIASRAGASTYYYDGLAKPAEPEKNDQFSRLARYAGNGGLEEQDDHSVTTNGTVVVGSYRPNAFGLYDTLGNVAEFAKDYKSGAPTGDLSDYLGATNNYATPILGGDYQLDGAQPKYSSTYVQMNSDARLEEDGKGADYIGRVGVRVFFVVESAETSAE